MKLKKAEDLHLSDIVWIPFTVEKIGYMDAEAVEVNFYHNDQEKKIEMFFGLDELLQVEGRDTSHKFSEKEKT